MTRPTTFVPFTKEEGDELLQWAKNSIKQAGDLSWEFYEGEEDDEDEPDDPDYLKITREDIMEKNSTSEVNGRIGISKVDKKKGLVFGWASVIEKDGVTVVDRDKDIIEDEWELEKSAYAFVASCRVGGEDHVRKGVSTLIESMVVTKEKIAALGWPEDTPIGWWTGWQITDADTLERMEKGEFTGFSVHGTGRRTPVSKAEDMTFNEMREAVQQALSAKYCTPMPGGVSSYCWVRDMSDSWVVFEHSSSGGTKNYRSTYTISDDGVELGEPTEVKPRTTYVTKGSSALERYRQYKEGK